MTPSPDQAPSPEILKGLHISAQGRTASRKGGGPTLGDSHSESHPTLKGLHPAFAAHIQTVAEECTALLRSPPLHFPLGATQLPDRGVYLFSEGDDHLYAGRSDTIRDRLNTHQQTGATVNQAAFAAVLAKEACRIKEVSYAKAAPGAHFSEQPEFVKAFARAKERIRKMDIRVIEETGDVRQALLETYVAIALPTRYNDFSNH